MSARRRRRVTIACRIEARDPEKIPPFACRKGCGTPKGKGEPARRAFAASRRTKSPALACGENRAPVKPFSPVKGRSPAKGARSKGHARGESGPPAQGERRELLLLAEQKLEIPRKSASFACRKGWGTEGQRAGIRKVVVS